MIPLWIMVLAEGIGVSRLRCDFILATEVAKIHN